MNFAKFLKTPFFPEHLWWLLLPKSLSYGKIISVVPHVLKPWFSRKKVQNLLSPFKSMIDNAIFKLDEQNNIFLSGTYLRITVFARFLTITNKLDSKAKVTFLSLLRIFSLELSLHSSLPLKTLLFTLKICFFCFFSKSIISKYANKFRRKGIPSTRFAKFLA